MWWDLLGTEDVQKNGRQGSGIVIGEIIERPQGTLKCLAFWTKADGAPAAATEKLARLSVGLQSDDRTVLPALCAQPAPPSSGR